MPRAKSGPPGARRHKKLLEKAKGYRGARKNTYRSALRAVIKGLQHAYRGRKQKKRDYRGLWIVRIGAAARAHGLSYSAFMHGLKVANVDLNRKVLADLAVHQPDAFKELVETARGAEAKR
ncbi:MAG: 50S ribosomal protein L20 [Candidatus Eisenbacteria bacterium]|nr:50S ribosomal protein L20 [Candidatus Eisenbacteria bacterium]